MARLCLWSTLTAAHAQEAGWFNRFTEAGHPVEFFRNEDINTVLPLAPLDYPRQLQGIIWMDQSGYYGQEHLPSAVPDGCFSFGDTEFSTLKYTEDGGVVSADVGGPAWQWFNVDKAYVFYNMLSRIGFNYDLIFTDNFNHAQIIPSAELAGGITASKELVNFEMYYQDLYLNETACPRHNTEAIKACLGTNQTEACKQVKMEVQKCAKWKRVSGTFQSEGRKANYYAYEIVDPHGQKREPYFSMYMDWIASQAKPSAEVAEKLLPGIDQFNFKFGDDMAFRGVRPSSLKEVGEQCDGHWECQSRCCKITLQFWKGNVCVADCPTRNIGPPQVDVLKKLPIVGNLIK